MHSMEVSSPHSTVEIKPCCAWLKIPRGVGFLAFLSLLLGFMVISFAIMDLIKVSQNELHIVRRERFNSTTFKSIQPRNKEISDKINKKSLTVWIGATASGFTSGLIQSFASIWFIYNTFKKDADELGYEANLWIFCHLLVILMFLTIFGAIFIAGLEPNDTIRFFGIDFIILNLFVLISVVIVRREIGQLKDEHLQEGRHLSALSALLVI